MTRHVHRLVPLLCILSMVGFCRPAGAKVLFSTDFDGSAKATTAQGAGQPHVDKPITYAPGVRGKAAVLKTTTGLSYAAAGNVSLDAGTLVMWVKPINWTWQSEKFVQFFSFVRKDSEDRSAMILEKYLHPGKETGLFFIVGHLRKSAQKKPLWSVVRHTVAGERKGKWAMLAATWDRSAQGNQSNHVVTIYLDGKKIGRRVVSDFPTTLGKRFHVIDKASSHSDPADETAVDALRLRDDAMSERQVAELYKRERPDAPASAKLDPTQIAPSTATIPRLSTAPRLDGRLGPNEWSDAAMLSGFSTFKFPAAPPTGRPPSTSGTTTGISTWPTPRETTAGRSPPR